MKTVIVEATQDCEGGPNWGKFLVGRLDSEWDRTSEIGDPGVPLLTQCGYGPRPGDNFVWVLDLQTREGAYFRIGGYAAADLQKHRIWVCPMFEPFLAWLYGQDLADLDALPRVVELPAAPAALYGYRRPGPGPDQPG